MDEVVKALEGKAGELKEGLETEAVLLQEMANQALDYGPESRVYNLRRGEIRRKIEDSDTYDAAKAVVALGDCIGISGHDEEREEEVRLAKEKWYSSTRENPHSGFIGDLMQVHTERNQEAKKQDLLSHGSSVQKLRYAVKQYEMLLYSIGEEIEGLDPETPYNPREYDAEFIEETRGESESEEIDLSQEFFSRMSQD